MDHPLTRRRIRWLIAVAILASIASVVYFLRAGSRSNHDDGSATEDELASGLPPVYFEVRMLQVKARKRALTPVEFDRAAQLARGASYYLAQARAISCLYAACEKNEAFRGPTVSTLAACLKDSDPLVRGYAARHLGKLGAREQVKNILPLFNNPNPAEHKLVVSALKDLGYQLPP